MAEQGAEDGTKPTNDETGENVCKEETPLTLSDQKVDELNDLLDDALNDFDKLPTFAAVQPNPLSSSEKVLLDSPSLSDSTSGATSDNQNAQNDFFNQIFSQSQPPDPAAFENFFSSLMSGDPSRLEQQFQNIDSPAAASGNLTETLDQTIGSLLQNTQQLQEDNIGEDEIMQMMSNMGLNGQLPSEDDFLPMMQGMMKDFLSKDVLYPSLKETSAKYPKWLLENKGKVDDEQFRKYEEQHRLMSQIVQEFEEEKTTDADDVKQQRFARVVDTMQRMQEFGHPPPEIVGEMPNGFELDEDGLPNLPSGLLPNPEQCCVM